MGISHIRHLCVSFSCLSFLSLLAGNINTSSLEGFVSAIPARCVIKPFVARRAFHFRYALTHLPFSPLPIRYKQERASHFPANCPSTSSTQPRTSVTSTPYTTV